MTEVAIVGGRLVMPSGIVHGRALVLDGERIVRVCDAAALGQEVARIDVQGRLVAPGLIDIHVHGAGGSSFADLDEAAWTTITETLLESGVTSCFASIAAAPIAQMAAAVDFARCWMAEERPGSRVLGVHLEGPYLSYEQRGAQNPDALRVPTDGSLDELLGAAGVVRMMTFAPELPGGLPLASRLRRDGIVAAVGHSAAGPDVLSAAIDHGATHLTHLWSGMSNLTRSGPWRMPGLIDASLASDDVTAEIIADGKHLPETLIKIALRCLGPDRVCVVSDAIAVAGMPEGTLTDVDGVPAQVKDGVAITLDETSFAGSTTLLGGQVRRLAGTGMDVSATVRMASGTPARAIGKAETLGSLEVGRIADLQVLDDELRPWGVMQSGRWVLGQPDPSSISRTGGDV